MALLAFFEQSTAVVGSLTTWQVRKSFEPSASQMPHVPFKATTLGRLIAGLRSCLGNLFHQSGIVHCKTSQQTDSPEETSLLGVDSILKYQLPRNQMAFRPNLFLGFLSISELSGAVVRPFYQRHNSQIPYSTPAYTIFRSSCYFEMWFNKVARSCSRFAQLCGFRHCGQ